MDTRIVALALLALTPACGGGGSGGSGEEPSGVITTDNVRAIAGEVAGSVMVGAELGTSSSVGFRTLFASAAAVAATRDAQGCAIGGRLPPGWSPCDGVSPGIPVELLCDGGGSVLLTTERARSDQPTAGDRSTADYRECDSGDGAVLNGRVDSTVRSWRGAYGDDFALGLDRTFTDFVLRTAGHTIEVDGLVTHSIERQWPVGEHRVAGASLALGMDGESLELRNFEVTIVEDSLDLQYAIDAGGVLASSAFEGEVLYDTVTPLDGDVGAYPGAGVVEIRGASGARIRLTASLGRFYVVADVEGDGVLYWYDWLDPI